MTVESISFILLTLSIQPPSFPSLSPTLILSLSLLATHVSAQNANVQNHLDLLLIGLGSERGGRVEDRVEEMTPVQIGGEERYVASCFGMTI